MFSVFAAASVRVSVLAALAGAVYLSASALPWAAAVAQLAVAAQSAAVAAQSAAAVAAQSVLVPVFELVSASAAGLG
jgi:hypothetical protein